MDIVLRYRSREVATDDVVFIRDLIAQHPEKSRYALSKELCQAWDWRQENGALKDMVCRGLMLALHRAGEIELPPARQRAHDPRVTRPRPAPVLMDRTPLHSDLADLRPLEFVSVRRTADEGVVDGLLEEHHYLGYTRPVGESLKYLVLAGGRPVACFAWSSAPRHLGPRDRFIGWSREARKANIRFLAFHEKASLVK